MIIINEQVLLEYDKKHILQNREHNRNLFGKIFHVKDGEEMMTRLGNDTLHNRQARHNTIKQMKQIRKQMKSQIDDCKDNPGIFSNANAEYLQQNMPSKRASSIKGIMAKQGKELSRIESRSKGIGLGGMYVPHTHAIYMNDKLSTPAAVKHEIGHRTQFNIARRLQGKSGASKLANAYRNAMNSYNSSPLEVNADQHGFARKGVKIRRANSESERIVKGLLRGGKTVPKRLKRMSRLINPEYTEQTHKKLFNIKKQ